MTMKRGGRHGWWAGVRPGSWVIASSALRRRLPNRLACRPGSSDNRPRGFARFPPRAKPLDVDRDAPNPRAPSTRSRGALRVERRNDLGRVALRLHSPPDAGDPPVGVDEERRPRGAPVGLPVVLLLNPRAVRL